MLITELLIGKEALEVREGPRLIGRVKLLISGGRLRVGADFPKSIELRTVHDETGRKNDEIQ